MVHEGDEEAGDEAGQREQNCPRDEAGEGEPDEGPVPVQAAVRPLEHPGQRDQRTTTRSHVGPQLHALWTGVSEALFISAVKRTVNRVTQFSTQKSND